VLCDLQKCHITIVSCPRASACYNVTAWNRHVLSSYSSNPTPATWHTEQQGQFSMKLLIFSGNLGTENNLHSLMVRTLHKSFCSILICCVVVRKMLFLMWCSFSYSGLLHCPNSAAFLNKNTCLYPQTDFRFPCCCCCSIKNTNLVLTNNFNVKVVM